MIGRDFFSSLLGTEHTTYRLTENDALEVIPELSRIYGEPFADSSQIPTVLLCRKARQAVTVALTGDGGDEIFGGYNRHVLGPKFWSRIARMPGLLRRGARPAGRVLQYLGGGGSPLLRAVARRAHDEAQHTRTDAEAVGCKDVSPSVEEAAELDPVEGDESSDHKAPTRDEGRLGPGWRAKVPHDDDTPELYHPVRGLSFPTDL